MKKLIFLLMLAGWVHPAQSADPGTPTDVTLSVWKGVNYFRAQAATNEDGWLSFPLEGNRLVGWRTNTVHYRIAEINIPAYKYSDPYEVMVPGNSPTDPMRTVTRWRTQTPDPSHDHKEKREVYDPNGPITHENTSPIYDRDSSYRWPYGGLGNNGLAIVALRHCGIRGDDPLVVRPAYNFASLIGSFGLPDNTFDLAWMTAAFAVLPGEDFQKLTRQCAGKLLDAQITTGPAAGMWGPVAVNPTVVSAYLKTLGKWGEAKKALQLEMTEAAEKASKTRASAKAVRLEEEMEKIDGQLIELQANSSRFTQLGLLMYDNFGYAQYGLDGWGRRVLMYQGERLSIATLPYLIENQITADLESTALVLYALRLAAENDRLPEQSWRPIPPKVVATAGTPPAPSVASDFPPARTSRDVLTLAAQALKTARPADGQWTEMNIHQRVSDFVWLKSIPQLAQPTFPLPSPVTLASVARGNAAVANLQWLQSGKPGVNDGNVEKVTATAKDNARAAFDALMQASATRNKAGKPVITDVTAWNAGADWLIRQQSQAGTWGRDNQLVMTPSTSLQALRQTLKPMSDADLMKAYDQPHLTPAMFSDGNLPVYSVREVPYETAEALLYLSDGLPDGWAPQTESASTATTVRKD